MSTQDILIGVDLGTSALKVVAFDSEGHALASASREYPLATPRPNWAEQNPEDWWKAACSALRSITKKINPERIAGISFSGQMHGSVFLDDSNKVIRPALLWNDGRTAGECAEIVKVVGRKALLEKIRNLPLTSYTLPKLLWLKNHEKANYERLRTVLLPKDYVRFRMTDSVCMDTADGAGTLMMEVGRKQWAHRMLEKLGLDPVVLPPLAHSTDVVGAVTREAAKQTGLPAGTLVVAGGGDQPVGAVGVGVFNEGQAMISLGTSGVVFAPTTKTFSAGANGLASFDHAVAGRSYLMGCVLSAGGSLAWYRNQLCAEEMHEAKRQNQDVYDLMLSRAGKIPIGCEDLLFLPYLTGERTPHPNPNARGAFVGLSLRHTKEHMTRAVVEGISYALRDCLELVRAKGVELNDVRVTGGGARSEFWLKMLADVFCAPVRPVENPEGGSMGAALLAGVGVGVYKSFEEAAKTAIRTGKVVKPTASKVAQYEAAYQRYRMLYPALEDQFKVY